MKRMKNYYNGYLSTIIKLGIVTFFVLLPLSLVSANSQSKNAAKDKSVLRIIYSGGIKGNIKPCG